MARAPAGGARTSNREHALHYPGSGDGVGAGAGKREIGPKIKPRKNAINIEITRGFNRPKTPFIRACKNVPQPGSGIEPRGEQPDWRGRARGRQPTAGESSSCGVPAREGSELQVQQLESQQTTPAAGAGAPDAKRAKGGDWTF